MGKQRSGLASAGVLMSVIVHHSSKAASVRTHIMSLILSRNFISDSRRKYACFRIGLTPACSLFSASAISNNNTKCAYGLLLSKPASLWQQMISNSGHGKPGFLSIQNHITEPGVGGSQKLW